MGSFLSSLCCGAASAAAAPKGEEKEESGREPKIGGEGGRIPDLREEELHRISGRMFVNGASRVACLHTQQGRKGTNQDAMLVWEVAWIWMNIASFFFFFFVNFRGLGFCVSCVFHLLDED